MHRIWLGMLFLVSLAALFLMTACENEPPIIHIYDSDGDDLMDGDGEEDSCASCHADEEYLRNELEVNPIEEPPESSESEGEG